MTAKDTLNVITENIILTTWCKVLC